MLITVPAGPAAACWPVAGTSDLDETGDGGRGFTGGGALGGWAGMQAAAGVIRQTAIINNTMDFAAIRRKYIIYNCIIGISDACCLHGPGN